MLRLSLFGGVAVTRRDGIQPDSAATQRRVLALLALAAGGGPAGITRDRAMAILWPDADTDRARHALSQMLYHTRGALRTPDIFEAGTDIRLNRAVIESDLWEFEQSLSDGNDARAIEVYRGPFLDGFNLSGSMEFEEWSSSQRRHIAARATEALERLSARAEGAGEWSQVVTWRQRLFALDITSSRAALKLMEALVKAGDPAAALRQADVHRRAVRALLETEPDQRIAALEAEIRVPRVAYATPPTAKAGTIEPALVRTPVAPVPERSAPASVSPRTRTRRWAHTALSGIAAAVIATGVWFVMPAHPPMEQVAGRLVIAPFRVTGPDLAYLHEGIVDLLSGRMRDSLTSTIDPGQAMAGWRRLGKQQNDVDEPSAIRLAKAVGASSVVVGSVIGNSERVHVRASLIESSAGTRDAEVSAEGPVDSLASVLDAVAAKLLAAKYGEADRLAMRRPPSLSSLRAYLGGREADRRGEYQTAVRQYEVALRADSQFALAAFQLALASDRINAAEPNSRALSIAWNGRGELAPRDRAQLIALVGPDYPRPSSTPDATSALTSAINLRPLHSEVWYEFGERLLRQGRRFIIDDPTRRAVSAFERALELDPADRAGARPMLVIAAARLKDTATMRRYSSPAAMNDSMRALSPFVRWTVARVRGDSAAISRMRAHLSDLDADNLRLIAMSSLYDDVLRSDGERAARLLGRKTLGLRGLDALLAQHAFALGRGDTAMVRALTERIKNRLPGMHAHWRLRILDAMYGGGDTAAAAEAAARLRQSAFPRHASELDRAVALADLCVLEQWRLRNGNTSRTASTIARLQRARPSLVPVAISANPQTCAIMLQTWLAVEEGAADAHRQLWALDSLLLDGPAAGDAARYAHIFLARLHMHFNDRVAALSALRRRSYLAGWPRYVHTVRATEAALVKALTP